MIKYHHFFFLLIFGLLNCKEETLEKEKVILESVTTGGVLLDFTSSENNVNIPTLLTFTALFDKGVDISSTQSSVILRTKTVGDLIPLTISLSNINKKMTIEPTIQLKANTTYELIFSSQLRGDSGESFEETIITFSTQVEQLSVSSFKINGIEYLNSQLIDSIQRSTTFTLTFSHPLPASISGSAYFTLSSSSANIPLTISLSADNRTIVAQPISQLDFGKRYRFLISSSLKGANDEFYNGFDKSLYTIFDPAPKFPVISDEELLTLVQQQTFKYFYDFAHPASGMARERK
ncbi:MAG: hypothetical protein EBU52_14195 [Cytophagia bacterium]|nr:hypothetical protein [Cytophagia bacterium]